jgi:hypothetical protein
MQGVTSSVHIGGLKYGARSEGNKVFLESKCHIFSR